ncbi:MAG: BatA domain-containing protein, partial [Rhodospirillales bacterium]|nr:BatA domain-containing protein [Rhodospirillales bacterium]
MAAFGALAFLTPWWLAALAALPILYWLLRVTPPAPRRARFPAIRLLFGLTPKEETPAKTPLWLLLLRLLVATLVILALAHPLLNPAARLDGQGPVIAVVDDGWTAGRNWAARKTTLEDLVDRAERAGRPVMLLTTAPSLTGEPPRLSRLMPAAEARSAAAAIEPKPWPVDRPAALAALDNLPYTGEASVVYLSDGLDDDRLTPFLERLQRLGAVELLSDEPGRLPRLLSPPAAAASELSISASRMETGFPDQAVLRASGDDGRLIAREDLRWAEADRDARVQIALPIELRNRIARIEIEGEASAGAVVLLDERWRRRPVGLVSGGPLERQQPLLADTYYLERALTPFSEVRNGTIAELLQRQIAVLVLADVGRLAAEDRNALDAWVRKGGMVIRFAGPRMANVGDDFVPAPLRGGGRIFGGAMSWAQPVALAPFEPAGPFDGLAIPPDVR